MLPGRAGAVLEDGFVPRDPMGRGVGRHSVDVNFLAGTLWRARARCAASGKQIVEYAVLVALVGGAGSALLGSAGAHLSGLFAVVADAI